MARGGCAAGWPQLGLEQNRNLFFECKNAAGVSNTGHRVPEGSLSVSEIGGKVLGATETLRLGGPLRNFKASAGARFASVGTARSLSASPQACVAASSTPRRQQQQAVPPGFVANTGTFPHMRAVARRAVRRQGHHVTLANVARRTASTPRRAYHVWNRHIASTLGPCSQGRCRHTTSPPPSGPTASHLRLRSRHIVGGRCRNTRSRPPSQADQTFDWPTLPGWRGRHRKKQS